LLTGLYISAPGHPLTESELLSVCHAPVDSPARNRGLTLKRVKKLGNRKQVEKFFGEAPPQPASPTSPTYFAGAATPRDSVAAGKGGLSAGAKKMNRASTISVMAGLGVDGLKQAQQPPPPMPLSPAVASSSPAPTPAATTTATSATRSPSSGSFLISKGRKMYNFFGHRPPSELISTHLTEYFPKVQKKVLERTARNSMMRITSGDGGVRGSWATAGGEGSARLSTSSFGDSIASPRKKRISQGARSIASSNLSGGAKHHPLHRTSTSPPRSAIPEDASPDDPVGLPRVSISTDGVSESESEAGSVDSRPPLLPPVDTSADSWSDSLSIYSPNFIAAGDALRRNSIASARPMSLLSQFRRRKKDTSDTASFLTVDEITAHVDSKRSSQDSASAAEDGIEVIDDEDLDEDDDDVRTPAPPGRRFSRGSRRLDRVMSYYESSHGSGEDEDEGAYSDEAEDEDDDDEDEDSDDDEADEAADEQGKAFLSEGGTSCGTVSRSEPSADPLFLPTPISQARGRSSGSRAR
jgi:mitogen-activated protein kinase kinase kinase